MAALEVRRINCSACAAPLELYGGRKVETLTCSYCGTLLDAHADFKILARHNENLGKRNHLPLQIGMQGSLKGVQFRVIGLISYRAFEDVWTEFCLFSPTHGYAFLAWSNGHFALHRRERDLPFPSGSWANLAPKHKIRLGGRSLRFYEAYAADVLDVAGELPWRAEVGDVVQMAEAIDPPYVLSQEQEGEELEYYLGEYIDYLDIAAGFGLELRRPSGVHPAQPYTPSRFGQALGENGLVFAALMAVILFGLLVFGSGKPVLLQSFSWQQLSDPAGALTQPFQVEDVDKLVEVEFQAPVDNAWLWLEVILLRGDEELFTTGREISYYHGVEGGESWSEGSQKASLLFKVPEPGQYQLALSAEGSRYNLSLTINEGVLLLRWFLILLVLMLLAAAWPHLRRGRFEMRRWAPVTQDDDDDD